MLKVILSRPMQHGDTIVQVYLAAEASRLFRCFRATLTSLKPRSAGVSVVRLRPDRWGNLPDPLSLVDVSAAGKQQADLSLAQARDRLSSREAQEVEDLNLLLWRWLSGRSPVPTLDRELPQMRVGVVTFGMGASVMSELEALNDLEMVSSIRFEGYFRQGTQKVVPYSFGTMMRSTDAAVMRGMVRQQSTLLDQVHGDELMGLADRSASLFKRRAEARVKALKAAAAEALGPRSTAWLNAPFRGPRKPLPDPESTSDFETCMTFLASEKVRKPAANRYAWRA